MNFICLVKGHILCDDWDKIASGESCISHEDYFAHCGRCGERFKVGTKLPPSCISGVHQIYIYVGRDGELYETIENAMEAKP